MKKLIVVKTGDEEIFHLTDDRLIEQVDGTERRSVYRKDVNAMLKAKDRKCLSIATYANENNTLRQEAVYHSCVYQVGEPQKAAFHIGCKMFYDENAKKIIAWAKAYKPPVKKSLAARSGR